MKQTLALALAAALLSGCAQAQPTADPAASAASAAQARTWLANNAKVAGVTTTASGLQYRVLQAGPATGVRPGAMDTVKVHYEGKLLDGTVFDSSYQTGRPLIARPDRLVPGWTEALQLRRPGDQWTLWVPPVLGYGEEGAGGGVIPPNAVLEFKMELLDVLPRAAAPAGR